MLKKVRGGKITTSSPMQDILEDGKEHTIDIIKNVTIQNLGLSEINIIVNDGDKLSLDVEECISFGDIEIGSIVVVENGSKIRYMGVE